MGISPQRLLEVRGPEIHRAFPEKKHFYSKNCAKFLIRFGKPWLKRPGVEGLRINKSVGSQFLC